MRDAVQSAPLQPPLPLPLLSLKLKFQYNTPLPLKRSVEMRDEHRLVFADEFALSFHIHFYRLLKWLLAAPFVAAAAALLALHAPGAEAARLPSLSSPRGSVAPVGGGII